MLISHPYETLLDNGPAPPPPESSNDELAFSTCHELGVADAARCPRWRMPPYRCGLPHGSEALSIPPAPGSHDIIITADQNVRHRLQSSSRTFIHTLTVAFSWVFFFWGQYAMPSTRCHAPLSDESDPSRPRVNKLAASPS